VIMKGGAAAVVARSNLAADQRMLREAGGSRSPASGAAAEEG
jgi:hypothetical protein